jgi:hypothetical protein
MAAAEALFDQSATTTKTLENGLVEDFATIRPGVTGRAWFSPDRTYRYLLNRTWDPSIHNMLFIMLNPSTADAMTDDHTIRRCAYYARRHGYGGVSVANLFGLRATDPRKLLKHPDPAGPDNIKVLLTLAHRDPDRIIVAAWGAYDQRLGIFGQQVIDLFTEVGHTIHRLGSPSKDGYPRHPSRLGNGVPLEIHAEPQR